MAELIRRHGGEPLVAPSMREVPLTEYRGRYSTICAVSPQGKSTWSIFMTGVGLRTLRRPSRRMVDVSALRRRCSARTLGCARAEAGGGVARAGAACRRGGAGAQHLARDLAHLDAQLPVAGRRVAVQEYGVSNQRFLHELAVRGARVCAIGIYRWELPADLEPLRAAVDMLCRGEIAVVLFTSATQVHHLFSIAADRRAPLQQAFAAVTVASIGPVCSAALRDHGVHVDLQPAHPKMGQLVAEAARYSAARTSGSIVP